MSSVAGGVLVVGLIVLMIYVFGAEWHYGFAFPIGLVAGFLAGALAIQRVRSKRDIAFGWIRLFIIAVAVVALGIFVSDVLSGLLGPHTVPGGEIFRTAMLGKGGR